MQIAAPGDFNKGSTGMLPMIGTETAVKGTAPVDGGEGLAGGGRPLRSKPVGKRYRAPPDHRFEAAVFRTFFDQIDRIAYLFAAGRKAEKTDRAEAYRQGVV